MLVIWSNCDSMVSLSNHVEFGTNRRKGDSTTGWILVYYESWKLDVGLEICCPDEEFKVCK